MALSFGKNSSKSKATQNQTMAQTSTTGVSDRSRADLMARLEEIKGQAYQGFDPATAEQYLNPNTEAVIDTTLADIRAERGDLANLNRAATLGRSAKGLSDRRGVYEAQFDNDTLRTIGSTTAQLRQGAYDRAVGIAQSENANKNSFAQNTQARIDALIAQLLERVNTTNGSSSGVSTGKQSGFNFGFKYGEA